jgi:hypothetical protein
MGTAIESIQRHLDESHRMIFSMMKKQGLAKNPKGLTTPDAVLFYREMTPDRPDAILVAVNLDPKAPRETTLHLPLDTLGIGSRGHGRPRRRPQSGGHSRHARADLIGDPNRVQANRPTSNPRESPPRRPAGQGGRDDAR